MTRLLGLLVLLLARIVQVLLYALTEAVVVFVPIALAVGAIAWLVGADHPRTIALDVAGVLSGLWGVIYIGVDMARRFGKVREALQRRRIAKIMEQP